VFRFHSGGGWRFYTGYGVKIGCKRVYRKNIEWHISGWLIYAIQECKEKAGTNCEK
jgi:hypothetical protein